MTDIPSSFDILISDRLDPYWNLAVEEYLLDHAEASLPVLLLWRSAPSVIIGKNQNPWRECPVPWLTEQGILLARRISGGGAVYHDEGNLNYTFIMPRAAYSADAIFGLLMDILSDLRVTARRVNRTSLFVDDRKVSGNAFCFRRNAALHHGTLLIASDLGRVRMALQPPPWRFDTRATASIRSPVANLNEWDASLTCERVRHAFIARCGAGRGAKSVAARLNEQAVLRNAATNRSDAWLYERTPRFDVALPASQSTGYEELELTVERGIVVRVTSANADVERAWKSKREGQSFGELGEQPRQDQVFQSQTREAEKQGPPQRVTDHAGDQHDDRGG